MYRILASSVARTQAACVIATSAEGLNTDSGRVLMEILRDCSTSDPPYIAISCGMYPMALSCQS